MPFDSHSRAWLLHMLPERRARQLMPIFGWQWPDHLHLRWPWTHMRMVRRHIGPVTNYSADRLTAIRTFDYYDGPRGMRLVLAWVCALPAIGRPVARALATFLLLETIATRRQ